MQAVWPAVPIPLVVMIVINNIFILMQVSHFYPVIWCSLCKLVLQCCRPAAFVLRTPKTSFYLIY